MENSFIFYKSYAEALENVPQKFRLECYEAITKFALTGEEPKQKSKNIFVNIVMAQAKPQIIANNKRRENGSKGSEYGVRGGRPKKQNPIGVTEETPNDNDNDNANKECKIENEKEDNIISADAQKQTLADIQADMVKRLEAFKDSIRPFVDIYGRDMCNDFYAYWSEPNKSRTKFRAEQEKTWDVARRLERWNKNNFKNDRDNGRQTTITTETERVDAFKEQYGRILQRYGMSTGNN